MDDNQIKKIIKNNFNLSDKEMADVIKHMKASYDFETENDVIELADQSYVDLDKAKKEARRKASVDKKYDKLMNQAKPKAIVPNEILPPRTKGEKFIDDNMDEIADFLEEKPVKKPIKEIPEMLRKLREQPSHQDFNAPRSVAETLSEVKPKILEKGGSVTKLIGESAKSTTPKHEMGQITAQADDAYKAMKGPKKMFQKGSGRFGVIGALLGGVAGSGLLGDKAAQAADKVGAAFSDADPGTHLDKMIKDESEGSVNDIINKAIDARKKKEEVKPASEEAIKSVIKTLGGEADINPKKALSMLGEKDSPDFQGEVSADEDGKLDIQKELERRKIARGYFGK